MTLQNFFDPKSVAVIGASNDKNKVGYALISNLLKGAKRDIYPVTISEKEVLGLKAYASVKDIAGPIDLAVISVRADVVPSILEDCGAKKIPAAIVIAAGFKEIGLIGAELENKVAEAAKRHSISLLGPNCLGAIDSHADFNASFASDKPLKGDIGFISQSGALGAAVLDQAISEGVGFSKFVSLGNEADLTEIEFLEYLGNDPETRAILMYLEKLSDGPGFMELAKKIAEEKPIVLLKAGRSPRGLRAVMSHTGSLAPEDAVFSAACRQAGIIAVESVREFFNMAKLFQLGLKRPIQRLIVLTNAGGPAVIAADLIDLSRSLSLIELAEKTKEALRKALPIMAAFDNPVDVIGDALSSRYDSALRVLAQEDSADVIVAILTPQMMTEAEATAKLLADYHRTKKPVIPVFMGGPAIEKGLAELKKSGMVNFAFPKDAVEALDDLARGAKKPAAKDVVPKTSAKSPAERMLPFNETQALFKECGLALSGILVKDKKDLAEVMRKAGGALYVLKTASADIIHKTEAGAVQLNLKTVAEAESAWDTIVKNVRTKNPKAVIEGMLVQSMMPGKEVIIGMKRDTVFGPTLLFGLGGIFTEALKDTSLRVAPIGKETANDMIREIRGIKILSGLRGEPSVDFGALADIIVKLSKLAMAHPEIKEIDLNPVMASPDGAVIADARVMI
ncbi:MAG: acetate--CoA ligase family protein [Minisyncoccia bacterium]|jgi:acetyltransferase